MPAKIYYLGTCSTCKRIMQTPDFVFDERQDIKKDPLTPEQLELLAKMAGSYETLFSRKAVNYRKLGLHEKTLQEKDYRELILTDYTFLRRPVIINNDQIFVGNSPSVVAAAIQSFKL